MAGSPSQQEVRVHLVTSSYPVLVENLGSIFGGDIRHCNMIPRQVAGRQDRRRCLVMGPMAGWVMSVELYSTRSRDRVATSSFSVAGNGKVDRESRANRTLDDRDRTILGERREGDQVIQAGIQGRHDPISHTQPLPRKSWRGNQAAWRPATWPHELGYRAI